MEKLEVKEGTYTFGMPYTNYERFDLDGPKERIQITVTREK